jgi:hypothetical protein
MSISGSGEEGKVEFAGRLEKWKFAERLDPKSDSRKDHDLENCESVYSDPIDERPGPGLQRCVCSDLVLILILLCLFKTLQI